MSNNNHQATLGLRRMIAGFFILVHSFSIAMPLGLRKTYVSIIPINNTSSDFHENHLNNITHIKEIKKLPSSSSVSKLISKKPERIMYQSGKAFKKFRKIGGPSQPEMTSFKSVGTDNMVNLFTGDFNYNIPLMDVGGYPINIFYDGGITMEQEASWVGLGWNINPGTVTRNMRGIPDDFDGTDVLSQTQVMKPNITWGVTGSVSGELFGLKGLNGNASLGFTLNNYLGPSLELGVGGSGSASFNIGKKTESEKTTGKIGVGFSANLSSRSGLTLSPNVSLTANSFAKSNETSYGVGLRLSTSYNSRSGIKELQISEQASANRDNGKKSISERDFTSFGQSLISTSISFAKPSYIPAMRMPLTNSAYSGRFQLGGGLFGGYGSAQVEVYKQKSEVANADREVIKPMIGYLHYEIAKKNPDAIMDFTRLNDNEVTENTPLISAPQYSYDVFSIQGEGTGGNIRAYRNDLGYVRDNYTRSQDKSFGLGADVSIVPPGHYGANVNLVKTPSTIGEWGDGNKLKSFIGFTNQQNENENVYFRNPGETSVLNPDQYSKIGDLDLVRFALSGNAVNPSIEPKLERIDKTGIVKPPLNITATPGDNQRKKRTQVTSFLTADEAQYIGLDKTIKSYNRGAILTPGHLLNYTPIERVSEYRKSNHFSQVTVTEADGKRYIYGIPVYNVGQKDFTFSVEATYASADEDKITFDADQADKNSPLLYSNSNVDGFLQITKTPPYAHSFLLSGLLSPDYVDITGNGITEDDLGTSVKFNYTKMDELYKWRTPLTDDLTANFNAGKRSEIKDDKGAISYGERESWYLHSIESKTMIAIFTLEDRLDGRSASGELSGINANGHAKQCLKKIDLYSKSDIKQNGIGNANTNAKPIKTVNFDYTYDLCNGTPDAPANTGKLTLSSIYFTYNGRDRSNKSKYVFAYTNEDGTGNPPYLFNGSDRWGTYKSPVDNPASIRNAEYSYSLQDGSKAAKIKENAGAWALKRILLPSGGQIKVEYESDDYAYVQDKRAAQMMQIDGFGQDPTSNYKAPGNTNRNCLYRNDGSGISENMYVFIKVPVPCITPNDVNAYLEGQSQFSFKLAINMPKGLEYITTYAELYDGSDSYGVYSSEVSNPIIWIKLKAVNNISPLTLSALEFLRQQLPGQAFPGYDVSESTGLAQAGQILTGMLVALKNAFTDPLTFLRSDGKAKTVNLDKSFVRLNNPIGFKYGGGHRVKSIRLNDNWDKMNKNESFASEYGQDYTYTTTAVINDVKKEISSGVASYEPSLGGEENPFHTIIQVANKLPLGPASYGAIEMPVLDAFFPSPSVGYSKVTVKSINKNYGNTTPHKSRSGIGKQVTEFYTAKDFPTTYSNTFLDPASNKEEHQSSLGFFFYKYAFDGRALSQGFLVETNDMHGKMKSQSSYPENDENAVINYTENFYRNTGSKGLDEKFQFVNGSNGGMITDGNMGVDVELMTDTREFSVQTKSLEVQGQVDLFPVIFPFWIPFIWPVIGKSESTYRAVTTTKVVNYHSIVDSVIVIDKGSQVSTKNLVYDAETGDLVVSRTNNEFDEPVYNTSYPAYWAYKGMGLAYKNIDATYKNVSFSKGEIVSGNAPLDIFTGGDELYLLEPIHPPTIGSTPTCEQLLTSKDGVLPLPDVINKLWVVRYKNSLSDPQPAPVFIDENGNPFTKSNVSFKIVRSGYRNMLSAKVQAITSMTSPIDEIGTNSFRLKIDGNSNVINASGVEYEEKWKNGLNILAGEFHGCREISYINYVHPYTTGLLGTFRSAQTKVFLGQRKRGVGTITTNVTNISKDGYLLDFSPYWDFDNTNRLLPATSNLNWVPKDQLTKINSRGLEIETKNALDIYTSAQYGFNESMPVAVTNNSICSSMASEGFEDYDYLESLNTTLPTNLAPRHIDMFSNYELGTPTLINTKNETFSAHTGKYVMGFSGPVITKSFCTSNPVDNNLTFNLDFPNAVASNYTCPYLSYRKPIPFNVNMINNSFLIPEATKMYFSVWVREKCGGSSNNPCNKLSYTSNSVKFDFGYSTAAITLIPSGSIIDGWQRIEGEFDVPTGIASVTVSFQNGTGEMIYYDDLRFHPYNANMKSYVYDPVNLRLIAELDANNYATYYEYDEEGTLVRTKAETKEGIKTINETRSAKQSGITQLVQ